MHMTLSRVCRAGGKRGQRLRGAAWVKNDQENGIAKMAVLYREGQLGEGQPGCCAGEFRVEGPCCRIIPLYTEEFSL